MKYIINIGTTMLLLVNIAAAQLTPWYLTGNSIASGDFLGTTNGQPLDIKTESGQHINFYTNAGSGTFNNQRMIITSGGNVGVNLTSPANLLHVDAGKLQITNGGTTSATGTDGFLINQNGSNVELNQQENANMNFFTNGSQKMTILSGGNVGVNLTSPANLLHVDAGKLQITNAGTTSATGTDGFLINQNGSNVELNQQENADMNFFTNGSQKMTILSGGNVGIGSNAPADKLHINDGSTPYARFTVTGAPSNDYFKIGYVVSKSPAYLGGDYETGLKHKYD